MSCSGQKISSARINDEVLNSFVTKLKQQFGRQIKKIILFGSRARRDNDPYSDYDFLIICEDVSDGLKKYVDDLENEILLKNFALVSACLISEKEFKKRIYEPYLMNAKKEGVLV